MDSSATVQIAGVAFPDLNLISLSRVSTVLFLKHKSVGGDEEIWKVVTDRFKRVPVVRIEGGIVRFATFPISREGFAALTNVIFHHFFSDRHAIAKRKSEKATYRYRNCLTTGDFFWVCNVAVPNSEGGMDELAREKKEILLTSDTLHSEDGDRL